MREDVETLAGRRGPKDRHALRWGDFTTVDNMLSRLIGDIVATAPGAVPQAVQEQFASAFDSIANNDERIEAAQGAVEDANTALDAIGSKLANSVSFRAKQNGTVSLLDLVAYQNPSQTISLAKLSAENILLDGTVTTFFEGFGGEEETEMVVVVDNLTVENGRVRGRVQNTTAAALGEVVVHVRLIAPDGAARTTTATVYGVAPGREAWFGIPLVGQPVAHVELVDVQAALGTASAVPGQGTPQRHSLPAPSRRSGVGGMPDVQRQERDMQHMQDAARAATGGQRP